MKLNLQAKIKIALSVLFFLCLIDMPYGYYQFIRFAALIGFGVLAYQANVNKLYFELIIYASLALLFQPFFKISLGRQIWNILDIAISVGLMVSIIIDQYKKQR